MRATLLTRIAPVVIFVGALAASSAGATAPEQARNGLIAFVDDRAPDDGGEIYAVGIRGGQARDVGLRRVPDSNPVVSADGRPSEARLPRPPGRRTGWIAYSTMDAVRAVHPDGSEDHLVAQGTDASPSWSPDGEWILYSGVNVVRVDGSGKRHVTAGSAPSWQPLPE